MYLSITELLKYTKDTQHRLKYSKIIRSPFILVTSFSFWKVWLRHEKYQAAH